MTCRRMARGRAAALSLLLAALPCGAQKPAPSPAPGPAAPKAEVDPVSKVPLRGLMLRLAKTMSGQPVMAVSARRGEDSWSEESYKRARTTLERLQVIAEAYSPEGASLIPYQVGGAWAIAPETREHLNPNLGMLSAFEVSDRDTLLESVLTALTDAQIRQLGTADGAAVSSLPSDVRAVLSRALRPPLRIVTRERITSPDESGRPRRVINERDAGSLDEEIDWSRARVRVRLRGDAPMARLDSGAFASISPPEGALPALIEDRSRSRPYSDRGLDLPVYDSGPNTYKPSDLAGKPYTQPLGLSGVWLVKDVLNRLSAATGLKLAASPAYADEPMFLGSPSLTAGQVIDGLRLCFTASWRRLGDTCILAWDRMPMAAIQLLVRDATAQAGREVRKRRAEMDRSDAWLTVADAIPFAEDDPLALSAQQRATVFGAPPVPTQGSPDLGIPWEQMSPSQQAFIQEEARNSSVWVTSTQPDKPATERPWVEDEIRRIHLGRGATLEWQVQLPSVGWARLPTNTWGTGRLTPNSLQRIRDRDDPKARNERAMQEVPPEIRAMVEHPEPSEMRAAERAMAVPPLSAARLGELAKEMKRHGFNVLLYPILFGGYATIPSRFFPLDPALKGQDGLSAAAAAMAPQGIRVIGIVNTLTWQNEGDTVHWLSKHPGWIDADAAGRTSLTWYQQHPNGGKMGWMFGSPRANMVRASEPAVGPRLEGLVREAAARKELDGLALDQWQSVPALAGVFGSEEPPALGFALPDRVAGFRRTGMDPADEVTWDAYLPDSMRMYEHFWRRRSSSTDAPPPARELVDRLLALARTSRKDWRLWLFDPGVDKLITPQRSGAAPAKTDPAAVPDVVISSPFMLAARTAGGKAGVVYPIMPGNFFDTLADVIDDSGDSVPDVVRKLPSIAVYHLMQAELSVGSVGADPPAMVYDFRTAPGEITSSLAWVKPPAVAKPPAATKEPGK